MHDTAGADPGQDQRVDPAGLELLVQVGGAERADTLSCVTTMSPSCGAIDSGICVAGLSACMNVGRSGVTRLAMPLVSGTPSSRRPRRPRARSRRCRRARGRRDQIALRSAAARRHRPPCRLCRSGSPSRAVPWSWGRRGQVTRKSWVPLGSLLRNSSSGAQIGGHRRYQREHDRHAQCDDQAGVERC